MTLEKFGENGEGWAGRRGGGVVVLVIEGNCKQQTRLRQVLDSAASHS